jgi:hypothetical protein
VHLCRSDSSSTSVLATEASSCHSCLLDTALLRARPLLGRGSSHEEGSPCPSKHRLTDRASDGNERPVWLHGDRAVQARCRSTRPLTAGKCITYQAGRSNISTAEKSEVKFMGKGGHGTGPSATSDAQSPLAVRATWRSSFQFHCSPAGAQDYAAAACWHAPFDV